MVIDATRANLAGPSLRWEEEVPVSVVFDDPYYSRADGLAEARHVFLDGNDLPARFSQAEGFHIAELGFGTGLNFLAAVASWRSVAPPGVSLRYTAFELYPMSATEIGRALKPWPELASDASALCAQWPAPEIALDRARLNLVTGDARDRVPLWPDAADAWFLDGFAPARNPELWEPDLMQTVYDHTVPGGTAATYSAAGAVRRALAAAGFSVAKRPGFGRKRDMTVARRPEGDE